MARLTELSWPVLGACSPDHPNMRYFTVGDRGFENLRGVDNDCTEFASNLDFAGFDRETKRGKCGPTERITRLAYGVGVSTRTRSER